MKREELLKKVLKLAEGVFSEETIEEIKDYSEEDLKLLLEDLNDFLYSDEESEEPNDEKNPEIIAGWLACQEEEMPEISEETVKSELFNDMITMAESVVAGVRVMVEGGIDYANALAVCNNYLQNKHNLQMAAINQVQADKNQI